MARQWGLSGHRFRYRRRSSFIAAACVAPVLVLLPTSPAHATNDNTVRVPDGTPVYLYRNSLTTGFYNAVEYVRQNGINPTDMTSLYASGVSSTYINIVDNDYGPFWFGMWDCATGDNVGVCSRGDVFLNIGVTPPGGWSDTKYRSLVCEEMGHGIGLAHRYTENGCMSQDWADTDYSSHDDAHLNSYY